jgi:hypothetical protein
MRRRFNPGVWGSVWLNDLQDRFGWEAGLVVGHVFTTYRTRGGECIAVISETSDQTGLARDDVSAILSALAPAIANRNVLPHPLRVVATPEDVERPNGRLSGPVWRALRAAIFKRDNYTCQYCGARGVPLECDHVHPISRGGSDHPSNLATACFRCNRSKRDKLIEEWAR